MRIPPGRDCVYLTGYTSKMQEKNEINSNFASFCAFYKKISKIMKELNNELAKQNACGKTTLVISYCKKEK